MKNPLPIVPAQILTKSHGPSAQIISFQCLAQILFPFPFSIVLCRWIPSLVHGIPLSQPQKSNPISHFTPSGLLTFPLWKGYAATHKLRKEFPWTHAPIWNDFFWNVCTASQDSGDSYHALTASCLTRCCTLREKWEQIVHQAGCSVGLRGSKIIVLTY